MKKKGQVGFDLAKTGVITILVIVILLFAGLITVTQLKNSGVFTDVQAINDSTNLLNNYSGGAVKLGGYIPTIMVMLGVLILIGIVVTLIVYIARSTGGRSVGI